jgi:hypothetical protein
MSKRMGLPPADEDAPMSGGFAPNVSPVLEHYRHVVESRFGSE